MRLFQFFLLFLPSLFSCAAIAAQPGWVTQPPVSSSLYLQGVGIAASTGNPGQDRQRADDLARAEIARQIRVTITARLTSVQREEGDAKARITQDTEQVIESSVSLTLDGVVIKDRYYDKKNKIYYALAVLNRAMAAERVGDAVRMAAERARALQRQAERHLNEGETYRTFLTLMQAARDRAAVAVEEAIYRALAANPVDALLAAEDAASPFSPTLSEIDRAIGAILSPLSFDILEGDRQPINQGRVAAPLVVRLGTQIEGVSIPAAGFPVRFRIEQGVGRLDEREYADRHGRAVSLVYQAGVCGGATAVVVAGIDTAAVRAQTGVPDDRWIDRLGGVTTRFTLLPGVYGFDDGIAELACRLGRSLRPETAVVIDRFTYQDTRVAGPLTGPLRRRMATAFADAGRVRLLERIELSAGAAAFGDPNATETIAHINRADAVIWGDYWEHGDSVTVNARVTGIGGARLASARIVIPRDAIPYTIRPPALDVRLPEPPADALPITVWTERGDGGLYVEGERLKVYARADTACYLRLLYRQADGYVIQIFPNALGGEDRVEAGRVYAIPDADDPYDFVIRPPFGVEYLIALAGVKPFPGITGQETNGGVLLHGTIEEVVQRLTGSRKGQYGQEIIRLTTIGR